jgi:hypothetical protein
MILNLLMATLEPLSLTPCSNYLSLIAAKGRLFELKVRLRALLAENLFMMKKFIISMQHQISLE